VPGCSSRLKEIELGVLRRCWSSVSPFCAFRYKEASISCRVEVATQPQGTGPTNKRVNAVVKGRSLGIFDTWRAVLTSVSGYPNAKYKSFRHRETAQDWYLEQLQVLGIIPTDQSISEDKAGDEDTVDYNSQGAPMGTNVPSRKAAPSQLPPDVYPAARQNKNADLVDFRMAGPDPSTGDGTKIHAVSINISSDVRNLYYVPKG
jgi:hypothetical protein